MGLYRLGKRGLHGDLIAAFWCLKGACREARTGLFLRSCSDRTRSDGYKSKTEIFRLDIRKKFFIVGH